MEYDTKTGELIDEHGHKWRSVQDKQLEYIRFLSIYNGREGDKDPQIEELKKLIGEYPEVIYRVCKVFKKRY